MADQCSANRPASIRNKKAFCVGVFRSRVISDGMYRHISASFLIFRKYSEVDNVGIKSFRNVSSSKKLPPVGFDVEISGLSTKCSYLLRYSDIWQLVRSYFKPDS